MQLNIRRFSLSLYYVTWSHGWHGGWNKMQMIVFSTWIRWDDTNIWKHPSSAPPTEGGWVRFAIIHQYHNLPPHRLHHHHHHNHHRITQVSDDLLRQMGSVDYEAVQRDLTLLMTDSQVVITLHYSQAVNTGMIRIMWVMTMVKGLLSPSWHIHIQYVTLLPGIMASRLWSLRASYGEACLAQLGLLQVIFITMLIIENAWKFWWFRLWMNDGPNE